jgi:Ca-activated chloride channel family protein
MGLSCTTALRAGAALVAIVVLGLGGVAYARECNRASRDAAADPPAVLIVMDASRSMAKPVGGGEAGTRLDAAKRALRTVVDGLPDGARVGLRLYGHRVSGATRAEGCRDTELVRPVGPLDRRGLTAAIDRYRAVGSTPIGRALRAASSDLPSSGPASIVLVSDGGDNCAPPDPCVIAGELAAAGRDLHIEAIGFQVGARARRQLRCIAAKGRGAYREAADADELAVALRALAARAARTYRPTGTAVRGGATESAAAEIGAGRYLDRIGADGERWYTIELREGQRLAAAAVVSRTCPFRTDAFTGLLATSLSIDLFEPGADYPEARSAVGNLFLGDESTESEGLLSQPVGPRADPAYRPSRPGRWLLRVSLNDNGLGTLAEVLEGVELPLQVQTNISGGDRSAPTPVRVSPADTDAPAPHLVEPGRAVTTLVAAVIGGLVLGVLLVLVAARLRRSPA